MRLSRRQVLTTAAALCAAPAGRAQARFPERPVRIVVPYGVGIGPDVVMRSVADNLQRQWRQPVVIDNKPGASGILAFSDIRRTAPDGYTLYVADTATMVVNPLINDQLPYDPARDVMPLTLLFHATFVVLVGGDSRWKGVPQLLEAARRETGRVSYASLGNGHASQMSVETLAHAAGVRLLHVPFKDAGALFTAVAAGEVDFTTFSMNTVAGLLQRGKLRALAVAAKRRLRDHPDLPTLAEVGAPPIEMHPWAGVVAPAGVPPPVAEQLQRDLVAAIDSPSVRERIAPLGFELLPSTPQQLRARMDADLALYTPLVREGRVSRL
ncbi:MAG TPA: tripartite tricarboxylate transporter substrate binding protein [Burkholderiaceae bacterium]|nr:tripartite tricarboxylate transporter substrate binding protein [Burkholderiaceae bacterium]